MRILACLLLALSTVACGARSGLLDPEPLGERPDAHLALLDGAVLDASVLDASVPDASVPGDAFVPEPTDPTIEPALAVSAGLFHTCAATRVGRVHCWGFNNQGQLGDGTSTIRRDPVASPGVSDATAVSSGRSHSCAVRADGTVLCWGSNLYGQLGDGSAETRQLLPVPVDGLRAVVQVDTGGEHTCAVVRDGRLYCWGDNAFGQVGPSMAGTYRRPVPVPLDEPIAEVSAGFQHTCVRTTSGRVICWGQAALEVRRPDDEAVPRFSPTAVAGAPALTQLSSGDFETCGVAGDGRVFCWGFTRVTEGTWGEPGAYDRVVPRPAAPVPGLADATEVSTGHEFACALRRDGRVACWGNNERGQLGDTGTDTTAGALVEPIGLGRSIFVSAGWRHGCALDESGVVRCWGRNWEGQLGDGRGGEHRPPTISGVFRE